MNNIIFNLAKIQTKLFISLIIVLVFYALYKSIPVKEFGKNYISNFDLFYYTILNHMGIHYDKFLNPTSFRAKLLTMMHLICGYTIILL